MKRAERWILFFIVALFIFSLDLISKWLIEKNLPYLSEIKITSFFNIVHFRNRGVVFGLFSDIENNLFRNIMNIFSILVMFFLLYFSRYFSGISFYVIGAMIGGACGNIFERLSKGYVVDFLDFHIRNYHWPAFNIADSTITIGMIIIMLSSIRKKQPNRSDIR